MEHKTDREGNDQDHEKIESSLGTMLFSILLVALSMGFVFGFKYYLAGKTYTGPEISGGVEETAAEESTADTIVLDKDRTFTSEYVMIQSLSRRKLWATKEPGKTDDSSKELEEGQILKVQERGDWNGNSYYLLDNGWYVQNVGTIIPLKEYVELKGYISITYISASGVRLRRWADFDADNVVGSVYVGDKVDVKGKVITINNVEAYVTKDGYYITTDSRYLNDHTTVVADPGTSGNSSDKKSGQKSGGSKDKKNGQKKNTGTADDKKDSSSDKDTSKERSVSEEETDPGSSSSETVDSEDSSASETESGQDQDSQVDNTDKN